MRIRSTTVGGFTTLLQRKHYTRGNCSAGWAQVGLPSESYIGFQSVKVIKDCLTPGFTAMRKKGKFLPLNPLEIVTTKTTRKSNDDETSLVQSNFVGGCYLAKSEGPAWGEVNPRLVVVPPSDESIINSIVNSAIADCKSSLFDALTTLAEAYETLDLLKTQYGRVKYYGLKAARFARTVYHRVYGRLRKLKPDKRKARSLRAQARAFASKWLEYRYGWLPAIYAAQDFIKAMTDKQKKSELVTGKAKQVVDLSDSDYVINTTTTYTQTITDIISGTRTYRAKAYARIDDVSRHRFGFDSTLTAWERVPFSFVVDWFVGVGDWLKAWSPVDGTTFLGCSVSVKDEYTETQNLSILFQGTHSGGATNTGATVKQVKSYTRSAATSPSPLPALNIRLNKVRVADLIALFLAGARDVRLAMR